MSIGRERCLEALEHGAAHIADIAGDHPDADVPRYPGIDLEALIRHLITIHEWAAGLVEDLSQERVPWDPPTPDLSGQALLDRFDAGWRHLAEVLSAADEEAEVWTFGEDGTVAFWLRRMAHEVAMHAWDADSAVSERPPSIPLDLAVTGLEEGLRIHVQRPLRKTEISGGGATVGLACTDADADWTVTLQDVGIGVDAGVGHPDARLAGTASDLWLGVAGRTPALPLARFGDEAVLERFENALGTIRDAV